MSTTFADFILRAPLRQTFLEVELEWYVVMVHVDKSGRCINARSSADEADREHHNAIALPCEADGMFLVNRFESQCGDFVKELRGGCERVTQWRSKDETLR